LLTDARPQFVEILSRQPLFRGLAKEELLFLAQGCREIRAQKHEILFQKGDTAEGMHVLVMGQVKLFLPSPQGSEKVVHMFESASTFGEAMVFLDKPYPVTAQATQDSLLLLVSKPTLLQALDANPLLCRKMLASLSTRLHELLEDLGNCTLRTSSQRVICFLLSLAPPTQPDRYEILLPASKQTIASQLNLAPETFSRVLGHLAEAGLIQVQGRAITVLDAVRLRHFTG
jgi:CRP-like cAMP-binding protein